MAPQSSVYGALSAGAAPCPLPIITLNLALFCYAWLCGPVKHFLCKSHQFSAPEGNSYARNAGRKLNTRLCLQFWGRKCATVAYSGRCQGRAARIREARRAHTDSFLNALQRKPRLGPWPGRAPDVGLEAAVSRLLASPCSATQKERVYFSTFGVPM